MVSVRRRTGLSLPRVARGRPADSARKPGAA